MDVEPGLLKGKGCRGDIISAVVMAVELSRQGSRVKRGSWLFVSEALSPMKKLNKVLEWPVRYSMPRAIPAPNPDPAKLLTD